MQRVIVLGRGAAGKSTFAIQLSRVTGLPVIELDQQFWSEDLSPLPSKAWTALQEQLAAGDRWIIDGDLGPYDAPAPRLRRAETVVILDLSLVRCAWRAARRSHERVDFWWWLITWRFLSRRRVLNAVATYAPEATLHLVRTPEQIRQLLAAATSTH